MIFDRNHIQTLLIVFDVYQSLQPSLGEKLERTPLESLGAGFIQFWKSHPRMFQENGEGKGSIDIEGFGRLKTPQVQMVQMQHPSP